MKVADDIFLGNSECEWVKGTLNDTKLIYKILFRIINMTIATKFTM